MLARATGSRRRSRPGAARSSRSPLQGDKFRRKEGNEAGPIDLVHIDEGQPYPLSLVVTPEGGQPEAATATSARPMAVAAKDDRSVTFAGKIGGLDVRKTFRLTGKPLRALALARGLGRRGRHGRAPLPDVHAAQHLERRFLLRPAARLRAAHLPDRADKTERYDPKEGKEPAKVAGEVGLGGRRPALLHLGDLPGRAGGHLRPRRPAPLKGTGVAAIALPLDRARKAHFAIYAGPKDLDTLRSYGRAFDTAIDYGSVAKLFALFARGLLYVMRWLQEFVRNWGVAIILLTLLVRLVLFPLTYKSMQSMNEMRKLQPGDREAQGEVRRRPREDEHGGHAALPAAQGEPARRAACPCCCRCRSGSRSTRRCRPRSSSTGSRSSGSRT